MHGRLSGARQRRGVGLARRRFPRPPALDVTRPPGATWWLVVGRRCRKAAGFSRSRKKRRRLRTHFARSEFGAMPLAILFHVGIALRSVTALQMLRGHPIQFRRLAVAVASATWSQEFQT